MFARRVRIMSRLVLAAFVVLAVRLAWLQIWRCDEYRGLSERNAIRREELTAFRGTIRDRRGEPLAVDKACFNLAAPYRRLCKPGPWRAYALEVSRLSPRELDANVRRVIARVKALRSHLARARGRPFRPRERIYEETIAHPIAKDIGLAGLARYKLHQERYAGWLRIQITTRRFYPHGDLAAQLIGYMQQVNAKEAKAYKHEYDGCPEKSYRPGDLIGRAGLERAYNRFLRGQRGLKIVSWAARRRRKTQVILERPPVPGDDVYLTLDAGVQAAAESALGSHRGAVVVLDPATGQILALASSPRYDLNTFRKHYLELASDKENAPLLDRALRGALPPGSIFKLVTAATALRLGKLKPDDQFYCPGYVRIGDVTLGCWAEYGHGWLNLHEALVHSCNVYFYRVAGGRRQGGGLTAKELLDGARRFGFGAPIAKDIPAEIGPRLPKLRCRADRMNYSCGQGALLVTPLQAAAMAAVIADRGVLRQPFLIRRIVAADGTVKLERSAGAPRRVCSARIAHILHSAMVEVPRRGTARGQGLDALKVACKTGTAQTAQEDVNHAWLVGYAPYDRPRYAFAVVCEKVSGHGGEVAGPVAAKMLRDLMSRSVAKASPGGGGLSP